MPYFPPGLAEPVAPIDPGKPLDALPTAPPDADFSGPRRHAHHLGDGPVSRQCSGLSVQSTANGRHPQDRTSKSHHFLTGRSRSLGGGSFTSSATSGGGERVQFYSGGYKGQSFLTTRASVAPGGTNGRLSKFVYELISSLAAEGFLACVILFNFCLIVIDTDYRAENGGRGESPNWIFWTDLACFALFAVEFCLRVTLVDKPFRESFREGWNILDLLICVAGSVDFSLESLGGQRLDLIRPVRLVRLLRILRVLRLFSFLKELRRLMQMMGSCFKTLFWSCLLLFLVMTTWAIVAVDVISPHVERLAAEGRWPDCQRCSYAFSTVFQANVTLFQTVVSGDSWGYLAIPVIESRPWTAVIFVGALMSLVFGVLNLTVAVIVDVFAESREKDFSNRADDLAEEEREQKQLLTSIFKKIDEDHSGSLSYEELVQGAYKVTEFARWLRVMDIDSRDLEQLFRIVDADGSGEINPEEFIEAMYRMKTADSKTATTFVKHIVTRLDEEHREFKGEAAGVMSKVLQNLGDISGVVEGQLLGRIEEQEQRIQATIEAALGKASEVALQAAVQAAAEAASQVMGTVRNSSKQVASAVSAKLEMRAPPQPLTANSSARPSLVAASASMLSSFSSSQPPLQAQTSGPVGALGSWGSGRGGAGGGGIFGFLERGRSSSGATPSSQGGGGGAPRPQASTMDSSEDKDKDAEGKRRPSSSRQLVMHLAKGMRKADGSGQVPRPGGFQRSSSNTLSFDGGEIDGGKQSIDMEC